MRIQKVKEKQEIKDVHKQCGRINSHIRKETITYNFSTLINVCRHGL